MALCTLMDSRLCHAIQCVDRSFGGVCFCRRHWYLLPETIRARVAAELAVVGARDTPSGSYSVAVVTAVRWLAVDERLIPGPPPPSGAG